MNRKFIISLALAAAMLPAAAQVNKEITVEREVVPTLRGASPLAFTPEVVVPKVAKPSLTYSRRTSTARIPALYSYLEPAAVGDSIEDSPWRGYAAIGYFPVYNLGASAGYRIIDRGRTTLDAWMQYDGLRYKPGFSADEVKYPCPAISHDLALGALLNTGIRTHGRFSLGVDYALSHFSNPAVEALPAAYEWQSVNRVGVNTLFSSKTNDLGYSLGLRYGHFAFAKGLGHPFRLPLGTSYDPDLLVISPARENSAAISAALFASTSETTGYRLDIDASMLSYGAAGRHIGESVHGPVFARTDAHTSGLIAITPRYTITRPAFKADIAARLDLSINEGRFFNIAPDVKVAWTPAQVFALWGSARGGVRHNTLGALFAIDRYIAPVEPYEASRVPLDAEAGFRVGPFRGASLNLSAAYAIANDWLMPAITSGPESRLRPGMTLFNPFDMRGWQFKAAIDYSYRRLLTAGITASWNPGNEGGRGYYTNRDRARYTLGVDLTVRPIAPLEVTASYELRACRSMSAMTYWYTPGPDGFLPDAFHGVAGYRALPNVSRLDIGASYALSSQLSVFLRAENILDRNTLSFSLIPGQGFHGLAGVAYKF